MKPSDIALLLTRPQPAAERFRDQLEGALGRFRTTVISPAIRIEAREGWPVPGADTALVFTSENAVRVARAAFDADGRHAYCVGDRTAEAARAAGYRSQSAGGDVADLAAMILGAAPAGPIVHLSGAHQAGNVVEALAAQRIAAQRTVIYDQVATPLNGDARHLLASHGPVLLPLFSPRTAELVSADVSAAHATAPLLLAFLSPAVESAWAGVSTRAEATADAPTAAEMVATIDRLIAARPDA